MVDLRQRVVRIGVGVAVAGEVLGGGEHVLVLHALHVGQALGRHIVFVFAKRAVVDHRVVGVVVHVDHRGEVGVHAHPFEVAGHLLPHFVEQLGVADGSERHLIGVAHRAVEPHPYAPLGIHRHKQRHFRGILQAVEQSGLSPRPALKHHQSAHLVLADEFEQRLHVRLVLVGVGAQHEELRHPFVGSESVDHRVDPGVVEVGCEGRRHGGGSNQRALLGGRGEGASDQ